MRPFTYLNLAISVDGKITTADRRLHGFGGPEDRDLMDELRSRADAVMIGAATLREEDPPLLVTSPERLQKRADQGLSAQPWNVIISRSLNLPEMKTSRFFQTGGFRKIIFTSEMQSTEAKTQFQPYADVFSVPEAVDGIDLKVATKKLYQMGVKNLLLEGGGTLNFAMLRDGLVDELFITLCPLVFGGVTAPTAFSGVGFNFNEVPELKLVELKKGANDRIFLNYRVSNSNQNHA